MSVFIGLVVMVMISISLISYSFITTKNQQRDIISRRLKDQKNSQKTKNQQNDLAARWFKEKAAPILAKPVAPKSASEQSNLKIRLANAGFRKEKAAVPFLSSKTICAVTLMLGTLVTMWAGEHTIQKIFGAALFAGASGFLLPDLWLYLATKPRQEHIVHGLPDCLDLMVVSVEAGLALDAALIKVSQEMGKVHKELSEEFMLVTMEIQMGLTRADALMNIAIRTGVPELKSLAAILVQAEKFGTSVATALRTHAETLRTKRRQEAEERAAKTAVKLIMPLLFFIFPAIFVVLAGPAALRLIDVLSSGVLQGGGK